MADGDRRMARSRRRGSRAELLPISESQGTMRVLRLPCRVTDNGPLAAQTATHSGRSKKPSSIATLARISVTTTLASCSLERTSRSMVSKLRRTPATGR